jgi:hypothetical protein
MMEVIQSSEASVLTISTRRNIPKDGFLQENVYSFLRSSRDSNPIKVWSSYPHTILAIPLCSSLLHRWTRSLLGTGVEVKCFHFKEYRGWGQMFPFQGIRKLTTALKSNDDTLSIFMAGIKQWGKWHYSLRINLLRVRNHEVSGPCPLFGILNNYQEWRFGTGSISLFRLWGWVSKNSWNKWFRLVISKGPNRVGVSLTTPEGRNESNFRNVVLLLI